MLRTCKKEELSKLKMCFKLLIRTQHTQPYLTLQQHITSHYVTFNTFWTLLLGKLILTLFTRSITISWNYSIIWSLFNNFKVTFSFARPACLVISRAILAPLPSAIVQVIESTDVYVWLFSELKQQMYYIALLYFGWGLYTTV